MPKLFEEIVVPQGVWEEVTARKPEDVAAQRLRSTNWIRRVDPIEIPATIAAWDLGKGESEVLSWVAAYPNFTAIIDDLAARRCADALNLKVIGTGATLILAKRRGLLDQVTPGLQALRESGLYLSDRLIALLKEQAGE